VSDGRARAEALTTRKSSLGNSEVTHEAKRKDLEDSRLKVMSRELAVDVKESNQNIKAVELVNREKRLAERQMQELATAQKRLEELQVSRAGEVRRFSDFLGRTKATQVPLGFSPLRSRLLAQEVGVILPLLDSVGAMMSKLEEVFGGRLKAEGHILAEAVVEHMLMCLWSRDPQVSLEPVVLGPAEEIEDAAQASVKDTARLIAVWLERLPEGE
jgi:hypothetical protein